MKTRLDERATLIKLIKRMDEPDARQLLAFAAGYEAGKMSYRTQQPPETESKSPPEKRST